MEKFEEIIIKYGCPKRTSKSSTTIEKIENFIKFNLPFDYTKYIQSYIGFETQIEQHYV